MLSPAFIGGISLLILKIICAQQAQADRESAVRHTFWRMSIYRRPAIRLQRTIELQSAAGGLKPLLKAGTK
jgi:hypothetical protein